jgi:hypothetical protein
MLIGGSAPGAGGGSSGADASLGAELDLAAVHADHLVASFDESPSRYVLEVEPSRLESALSHFARAGVPAVVVGRLNGSGVLTAPAPTGGGGNAGGGGGGGQGGLSAIVGDLAATWTKPLDW